MVRDESERDEVRQGEQRLERAERQLAARAADGRRRALLDSVDELLRDFAAAPAQIGRWLQGERERGALGAADEAQVWQRLVERLGPDGAERALAVPAPEPTRRTVGEETRRLLDRLAPPLGLSPAEVDVRVDGESGRRAAARGSRGVMEEGRVWLDPARYDPETADGRGLLAHEVAHVAQRAAGLRAGAPPRPARGAEREAAALAATFAAGEGLWAPAERLPALAVAAEVGEQAEAEAGAGAPGGEAAVTQAGPEAGRQPAQDTEAAQEPQVAAVTEEEIAAALAELEDPGSRHGWHRRLPRSDTPTHEPGEQRPDEPRQRRGLSYVDAPRDWPARGVRRTDPQLSYSRDARGQPRADAAAQTLAPVGDDAVLAAARDRLIAAIRQRLAAVQVPAGRAGGENQRLATFHGGYLYDARDYRDPGLPEGTSRAERRRQTPLRQQFQGANEEATAHARFQEAATHESLGLQLDEADRTVWDVFRWMAALEGETSSVNAHDNQILTIGAGFSGQSGNAGGVCERMPPGYHAELYRYGIRVEDRRASPDEVAAAAQRSEGARPVGFQVIDLNRGVVERGSNALYLLATDEQRLGVLIRAAQSTAPVEGPARGTGGQEERLQLEQRQWMLRAQFEQFRDMHRGLRQLAAPPWTEATRRFAARLHHWNAAIGYEALAATRAVPQVMAEQALAAGPDNAERRRHIEDIAGAARVRVALPAPRRVAAE